MARRAKKAIKRRAPRRAVLKVGTRVVVERPRAPFGAVVVRINAKSITVRDGRGKSWRVPSGYPMSWSGHVAKPVRTTSGLSRRVPGWDDPESPMTPSRPIGPHIRQSKRDVIQFARMIAARTPRERAHAMEGGKGISGWLWFQKKGMGKDIALSSNGEFSYATLQKIGREMERGFPGLTTWINLD